MPAASISGQARHVITGIQPVFVKSIPSISSGSPPKRNESGIYCDRFTGNFQNPVANTSRTAQAQTPFPAHDRKRPRGDNAKAADTAHALRFTPVPAFIHRGAAKAIIVDRLAKDIKMASVDEEVRDRRVEISWCMAPECFRIRKQPDDLDLFCSDGRIRQPAPECFSLAGGNLRIEHGSLQSRIWTNRPHPL